MYLKCGVLKMIDSLFDKKTAKEFNAIAREKAKVSDKERKAVKDFLRNTDSKTIIDVMQNIKAHGHPGEIELTKKLQEHYEKDILSFDDIMSLNELFKSNCKHYVNKDESYE